MEMPLKTPLIPLKVAKPKNIKGLSPFKRPFKRTLNPLKLELLKDAFKGLKGF